MRSAFLCFGLATANGRLTALTAIPSPPSINFVYAYPAAGIVTMDLMTVSYQTYKSSPQ